MNGGIGLGLKLGFGGGAGELLGPELVTNGEFLNWTADDPDDWTVIEAGDVTSNVTEVAQGMNLVSDGTFTSCTQTGVTTVGKTYQYRIDMFSATGTSGFQYGNSTTLNITSSGIKEGTFVAERADGSVILKRVGACDAVFSSLSIKEVL